MLELSAYFALVQIWSAISAAAILVAVNFVIAAILFAIAAWPPSGRDLELASEIHLDSGNDLELQPRVADIGFGGIGFDLETEIPAHVQHHDIFLQHVARNHFEPF